LTSKKYRHIFFDLDHTLWDYDANAIETLEDLYERFELSGLGIVSKEKFTSTFLEVNDSLWEQYNVGAIDKFFLRNERFRLVFEAADAVMKLVSNELLKSVNEKYLAESPQRKKLIAGAQEILEYLSNSYAMHLITNGFEEIQFIKIEKAGIAGYFDKIITSEKAGFKKPFPGIFTYALKHTGALVSDSIMIGDNLSTDIKGARDFGMDHVFFNPHLQNHQIHATYEINDLRELKNIL